MVSLSMAIAITDFSLSLTAVQCYSLRIVGAHSRARFSRFPARLFVLTGYENRRSFVFSPAVVLRAMNAEGCG